VAYGTTTNRAAARGARAGRGLALMLAAVLVLPGCYRSLPLHDRPEPGMRIMAGVTREGAAALEDQIGRDVIRVEAVTGAVNAETVELRLINTWDALGREVSWRREAVAFPRQHLHSLQERELDRTRTWLAAGAVTAAVVVLGRVFFRHFTGQERVPGGEEPPQ
jgi:hypothetical protein